MDLVYPIQKNCKPFHVFIPETEDFDLLNSVNPATNHDK
jgi:hypothetical protein